MMEKPKILIVDDKQANITALRAILEDLNAEVIGALSGNEAVVDCMEHEFALILMDVQMPGMDGFETLKYIRMEEKNQNIPVIFISAIYTDEVYKIRGIASGGIDFLTKPINEDILHGKISLFLDLFKQKKELILAKEKAEEADNLKSAFLANISHEIRTPLNAILGFSNIIKNNQVLSGEDAEMLDLVRSQGDVLLNLVNDIIDLAKIESGQLKIDKSGCKLNELLGELVLNFTSSLQKEIVISYTVGSIAPNFAFLTDAFRLKQILNNLVGNAVKFTEKGSIEIGYQLFQDEGYLEFYVQDTGVGIPKDKTKLIFERFGQADNSLNRDYSGAGLGLAISESLVNLLGGKIWVESEPGRGSTFYFTLPYEPTVIEEPSDLQPAINLEQHWEDYTLLVVEDVNTNQRLIDKYLGNTHVKCLMANDGEKAIELFKENDIDLILMDIKMPGMDGFETTRRIKQLDENIPIVAQTAYVDKKDKEQCFEAGCIDYLSKPIKQPDLISMVGKYLGQLDKCV